MVKGFSLCKAKGTRLYTEITEERKNNDTPLPTDSIGRYKTYITAHLLDLQSIGESEEWIYENFRLCNQVATRQSSRLKQLQST